jgi:hypothetical protein
MCGRGRTLANETRGKGTRESVLGVSRELDRFESCSCKWQLAYRHCHRDNKHLLNNMVRCTRGIASKQTSCVSMRDCESVTGRPFGLRQDEAAVHITFPDVPFTHV